eukprot:365677-Chlamydomonas_euryale.AAC.8
MRGGRARSVPAALPAGCSALQAHVPRHAGRRPRGTCRGPAAPQAAVAATRGWQRAAREGRRLAPRAPAARSWAACCLRPLRP